MGRTSRYGLGAHAILWVMKVEGKNKLLRVEIWEVSDMMSRLRVY